MFALDFELCTRTDNMTIKHQLDSFGTTFAGGDRYKQCSSPSTKPDLGSWKLKEQVVMLSMHIPQYVVGLVFHTLAVGT